MAELEHLVTSDQVCSLDEARLKRELKARFADTKSLMGRHVSSARQLLRVLMEHPLRCEAVQEGNRKEYRVTGTGSYLPLLPETFAPLNTPQERCSVVNGVPRYYGLEPNLCLVETVGISKGPGWRCVLKATYEAPKA